MTGTFPNGIASFTPKQDNVDVNYASDINRLQDEIVAIEQTLGALITTITDLSTEVTTDEQTEAEFEQQTTLKFLSLGDRLNFLQNGYHIRAAAASASDFLLSPSDIQNDLPDLLRMDQPPTAHDPYGLWNGKGLTLNKAGFWLIHGFVRFDVGDTRPYGGVGDNANWNQANHGVFQASLYDGAHWHQGADRKQVASDGGYWPNVFLNPVRMGWFNAGTKITLRASHNTSQKQHVFNANLSAVWLRNSGQPTVGRTPITLVPFIPISG